MTYNVTGTNTALRMGSQTCSHQKQSLRSATTSKVYLQLSFFLVYLLNFYSTFPVPDQQKILHLIYVTAAV